jgi:VTC domain
MPGIADGLRPLALEELTAAAELLDRVDRKYVVALEQLERLAERLHASHRVLVIDGRTSFAYCTTYFDTPLLGVFQEHVQRRRHRFKCRTRHYLDTGSHAFEVKLKGLRERTLKRRLPCEPLLDGRLPDPLLAFLRACLADAYGRRLDEPLQPSLLVGFHRTTLAAPGLGERVTIDTGVRFEGLDGGSGGLCADLAIVETKSRQGRAAADAALLALGARPLADCSKYCVGIGLTRPQARSNRFRPLMRRYFTTG